MRIEICKRFVRELCSESSYKNDRDSMVIKRNGYPRCVSHVSEWPSDSSDPDGASEEERERNDVLFSAAIWYFAIRR